MGVSARDDCSGESDRNSTELKMRVASNSPRRSIGMYSGSEESKPTPRRRRGLPRCAPPTRASSGGGSALPKHRRARLTRRFHSRPHDTRSFRFSRLQKNLPTVVECKSQACEPRRQKVVFYYCSAHRTGYVSNTNDIVVGISRQSKLDMVQVLRKE